MTTKEKTYPYAHLNYEDYFTICSQNAAGIEIPQDLELAKYESIIYQHGDHTHEVNYQVRYDKKRKCIQILFQQTASKSDWLANFEFPSKIYDEFEYEGKKIQIRAHGGWADMYFACKDAVRDQFSVLLEKHPEAYCEIIGWSLGSALAQLCAEDIYFKFNVKSHLFTYGSVKPFFGIRTKKYIQSCCVEAHNFRDCNDIVGKLVPLPFWWAIKHQTVRLEKFCLFKLFNPQKFHTHYYVSSLYKEIE